MTDLRIGGHVDSAHTLIDTQALIPSTELTTHAVIVGMTGSGKTGLGVDLIEECLASGVPALLIDPKGDLTNLALTFPDLSAAAFTPWVNAEDAAASNMTVEAWADKQAGMWREGLSRWGLGPQDVRALHEAVEVTIYTPGAPHGVGLNIIGSLDVPPEMSDPQAVAEEIETYVAALLNLVGIDADPLASREFILLSNIINNAWTNGRALDLAALVASVASPPMRRIGVLELDVYYPPTDRTKLAMKLNGLLASPAFASWLGGQRIDIESMLHSPDGKPRCAVVTTAHLSDEQRQSVTSVILSKLIAWMRRQSGTSQLRALLYMDEVAGYLPPTANPPTKEPILLLLKQARAFGVGVVLSTQNPVDLDYKALSNAGTWMIGRLQTEQDRARLVSGLSSAAGTIDPEAVSELISGLGKREFVLKRASRDVVEVFTTRWAMSYLRGPLSREQIAALAHTPTQGATDAPDERARAQTSSATTLLADDESTTMPKVATGIPVYYLDPAASWAPRVGAIPGGHLAAGVIARVRLRFDDAKAGIALDQEHETVLFPLVADPRPELFAAVDYDDRDLLTSAPPDAVYRLAPTSIATKSWWTAVQRELTADLVSTRTLDIPTNTALKLFGRIGEPLGDFAARCAMAARAGADQECASLQSKYEKKIITLRRRIDTATDAVDRQASAKSQVYTDAAIGGLLGGLFGGRRSSMATTARRASAASGRVDAAQDKLEELQAGLSDIQRELDAEMAQIRRDWVLQAAEVTLSSIKLAKTDVRVTSIGLIWIPVAGS